MKKNYEKFITDMIRYASSAESPDYIIQQILKYICENLDSDRAYIFEDNLYLYNPLKGNNKVFYNYELNFNKDNTIFMYIKQHLQKEII